MKKVLLALFAMVLLSACGGFKTYNSALKQIELGMTKEQVVSLMGQNYQTSGKTYENNKEYETIEYKDMYKFHWIFEFVDNSLYKWYKETEDQKK